MKRFLTWAYLTKSTLPFQASPRIASSTTLAQISRPTSLHRRVFATKSKSSPGRNSSSPRLKKGKHGGNPQHRMADQEERILGRLEGGRRGGGSKGRGRGGGNGSGGGSRGSRETQISRALSRLLRHQAIAAGIALDGEGYARLDKVLAWGPLRSLNVTFTDIRHAVADNEKQRYALKPNPSFSAVPDEESTDPAAWLIRANQGHSIKLESAGGLLTPITLEAGNVPDTVVHGTYFAFWRAILASGGLKPMGRNHVHCGTGIPGEKGGPAVVSGMRSDAEVIIYVDVEQSLRDGGILWWMSDNGVVLTEGNSEGLVPTAYFKRAEGRKANVGLLVEDGAVVADLPASLVVKVPQGKGRVRDNGGRGGHGGSGGRGKTD